MASAGLWRSQGDDSLVRRLASAVAGIPLLVLFIWAGGYWFVGLVVVAAVLGVLEFYGFSAVTRLWLQRVPGITLTVLLTLNGYLEALWPAPLVAAAMAGLLLSHVWIPLRLRPWVLTPAGALYLGGTLAYAILLRRLDQGAAWVLLALLSTFSVDTGAYFIGRALGRHRMAPRISPGKTWEGAIAGFAAGVGSAVLLASLFGLPLPIWQAAALGAAIGIVGQLGDLLESALKRSASVKEAGSLVPGHGGILDRLDSVVLNLVVVYHIATWGAM